MKPAFLAVLFFLALLSSRAGAAQLDRIHQSIDDTARVTLPGPVKVSLSQIPDLGPAAANLSLPNLRLYLSMTPAQQAEFAQLLQLQQAPHAREYHQWLTPDQFAGRFGASPQDTQKIVSWLELQGFSNVTPNRARTAISFSGNALQAQTAFHANIHNYNRNGVISYANTTSLEIPRALVGIVQHVAGLDNLAAIAPQPQPRFVIPGNGQHALAPGDFATIYDIQSLYGQGINGAGRTIAYAGIGSVNLSQVAAFRAAAGLPATTPQVITNGVPALGTQDDSIYLEWAGGVAPGANLIYVSSSDPLASVQYVIQNNQADVVLVPGLFVSCEQNVGAAEMASINNLFAQANAQGITVISSSGAFAAYDCPGNTQTLNVAALPASPYVTSVGGTTFNEQSTSSYWSSTGAALSYIPELSISSACIPGGRLAAPVCYGSGGGVSILNAKPSWQAGPGVPSDGARDVPDIAFSDDPSHDLYLSCSTSYPCINGFLSAEGAPAPGGFVSEAPFAGIVALLVQQTGGRLGNINPKLYTVASFSPDAFHDITGGNNVGYTAGPGYDLVTGLGSIDVANLVKEWNADFAIGTNSTSITISHGVSGTATINIAAFNNFSGTVKVTCSIAGVSASCTAPSAPVNGSGQISLTLSPSTTSLLPVSWPRIHSNPGLPLVAATILIAVILRRRKLLPALAALSLSLGLLSCGGTSGTGGRYVTGSGTLTVNATSGVFSRSASIPVTFQ